jgi:DNA repair exonuclease SbcCD ATPase subunit
MKLISLEINPKWGSGWASGVHAFGRHVTQITGPNGSGKTPVIQSIIYCLGYKIDFREDIKKNCASITLVIDVNGLEVKLVRVISSDFNLTASSKKGELIFDDELNFSKYLFDLVGLDFPELVSTGNLKTSPYTTTVLPLFFLDQDRGYSDIYKPPSLFIRDQFSEVVRFVFGFSQRHLFARVKDDVALKNERERLDQVVAVQKELLENMARDKKPGLSEADLEFQLSEAHNRLEQIKSAHSGSNDVVLSFDSAIYNLQKRIEELKRESRELSFKVLNFTKMRGEIEIEVDTLSLNESAKRLFETFGDVCKNDGCGLFKESSESYGKNLLYLKDQIKDLESTSNIAQKRMSGISEVIEMLEHELKLLLNKRSNEIESSTVGGLIDAIKELTSTVINLEQEKIVVKKVKEVSFRLADLMIKRERISDEIAEFAKRGRNKDINMVMLRLDLAKATRKWLSILGTEQIKGNITVDADLKFIFGNEEIRAFRGSTLVRVVLSIHAALFELYLSKREQRISFLIFDTPNQQEIETRDLHNFMIEMKKLCLEYNAQVIFASKDYHFNCVEFEDKLIVPNFPGSEHPMHLGLLGTQLL